MKKAFLTAFIAIIAFSLLCFGFNENRANAETWTPSVQKGVMDGLVPIGHSGGSYGNPNEYGSKLIPVEERGVNRGIWELSVAGGWGSRYSYDYTVDLDNFEITLDLSVVNNDGSQIAVIFGSRIGDYLNAENGGFGIKICRHNEQYGVVVSNQSHTRTIEEISPAPSVFPWDSQNSGYAITAEDGIITISFKKNTSDFTLKLNENEYSVPVSAVTDILGENTNNVYFAVGSVSDATEFIRIISLKETNSAKYEETVPAIISSINAYADAANGALDTPEKIVNAETLGENCGYSKLLRHDRVYFEEKVNAAAEKIEAARLALNETGKIALLKADTTKLKGMLDNAKTNSELAAAESYAETVKEKDIDDIGEISEQNKQSFNEAVQAYEAVTATAENARKRVVLAYVTAYEDLAENISGIDELKQIEKCRSDIYVNLVKLSQDDKNEIASKLVSIQEKVEKLRELPGWNKTENELTFNGGNYFEFSSVRGTGSITYNKPFKVNNVKFEIAVSGTSGWIALSLSKKQESFHYNTSTEAGIEEMQSNPSLVFMMQSIGGTKVGIEVMLIKSTHTSFFSASRGTMIVNCAEGEKITIEIKAENDVNSTYANIWINGEKFTGTPIKNSELKGAVGSDFNGYLSLVKNGSMSMRVNKVNGKNSTAENITDISANDDNSSSSTDSAGKPDESKSTSSSDKKKGCGSNIVNESIALFAVFAAGVAIVCLKKKKYIL